MIATSLELVYRPWDWVPGREGHCLCECASFASEAVGKLVQESEVANIPSLGTDEELLQQFRLHVCVRAP